MPNENLYKNDIENRFPTFTLAKTTDGDFVVYTLKDGSTLLATGRSLDAGEAVLRVREIMEVSPDSLPISTSSQRDALTGVEKGTPLLNTETATIDTYDGTEWDPLQILERNFTFQGSTKFGGDISIDPNGAIDVAGTSAATARIRTNRYQNSANGAGAVQVGHSRGSEGTPSALLSGDRMGQFIYTGDDGVTEHGPGPVMRAFTTENWSDTANGSKITVETIKPGATAETLAFTFSEHGYPEAPAYTVATLPNVGGGSGWIAVTDETGGYTMAFSDGTNWRRCQDRAIVA